MKTKQEIIKKAKGHGGERKGSGRKGKNYPVKQMGCRVPQAIFDKCVAFCKKETIIFENSLRNQK